MHVKQEEVIEMQSIQSAKNRSNCNGLGLPKIDSYNRNRNRKFFKDDYTSLV
jgi:hypothetical protein